LILDLKNCIKGLKEYYKYDNNLVMIKYPKLVYYTNYDRFFPTLDIKPYDSQITFIQSVKKALNEKASLSKPTLILYKTMIGSGKTSASIALS
jgi:transketolase